MTSYFQQLVRASIEHWFPNEPIMENYRPDWLYGMEIDLYLPRKNLAIEVQGDQHYRFVEKMQKVPENFKKLKFRDRRKGIILRSRGINFVSIKAPHRRKIQIGVLAKTLRGVFPAMVLRRLPFELSKKWRMYKHSLKQLRAESPSFKIKHYHQIAFPNQAAAKKYNLKWGQPISIFTLNALTKRNLTESTEPRTYPHRKPSAGYSL